MNDAVITLHVVNLVHMSQQNSVKYPLRLNRYHNINHNSLFLHHKQIFSIHMSSRSVIVQEQNNQ